MGPRRRGSAAERLAQALTRGDGPTELRSLLAHGPIANPSFEQARTLRLTRIEEAIALEADLDADTELPSDAEPVEQESAESPIASEGGDASIVVATERKRRGAWIVAAAALALTLGGLTAAAVVPGLRSLAPAQRLSAALAALPAPRLGLLAEPARRDVAHPEPAAADPQPDEEETIVVLDDHAGPRTAKSAGSRRSSRRDRPRPPLGLVHEATSALEEGARDDAIDLYERALTADPRSGAAAAGLSSAYFDLGRFDLATAFAEHAVKTDFGNAEYHVLLGDAYYRNAGLEDARRQWETAAKLGSNRARDRLAKLE